MQWLAGLGLAASLASCATGGPAVVVNVNDAAVDRGTLTVVTLNVLHGFRDRTNDQTLERRLDLVAEAVAAARPDLVLLQEMSVTRRHGSAVDRLRQRVNGLLAGSGVSYNSAFIAANGSRLIAFREGEAILSRAEILSTSVVRYRSQALIPPEHRLALEAVIRSTGGRLFAVSTHLTNTEASRGGRLVRTRQAGQLAAEAIGTLSPDDLLVAGGDFNDTPDSATVGTLLAAGAVDAWRAAHPGDEGGGLTSLAGSILDPAARYSKRIDFLFVAGGAAVAPRILVRDARMFLDKPFTDSSASGAAGVLRTSDHAGVAVDLAVSAP